MAQLFGRTKNIANRSKKYLDEALHKKLFKEGSSDKSVRTELNQFLKSSKRVYKWEVGMSVKKLRQRKRFAPAMKLAETMAKRGMNMTVSDQAIHLDIIAKAQGIPAAECYFIDLPESSKTHLTYGALLNCYCKELMTEKAEALMEKMKELGFTSTSMAYNSFMTLYTKTNHPEKIPSIIQEMKENDIAFDSYTYNVWIRALAAMDDIPRVEKVIAEIKTDDWTTYSNLASIYVNAGMFEKAENALKELEKRNVSRDLTPYQFLITLYGRIGNVGEVYRVWRSLRLAIPKTANISYLNMIQALVNLKDLPGAEKCFHEWESGQGLYDIRIVNALIGAYAKEGALKKMEELKERSRRSGGKANAKTMEIFMEFYLKNGETKLAVECLKNGMEIGKADGRKWVPSGEAVESLMGLFEKEKDVEGAEGLLDSLSKAEYEVSKEVFEALIRTYASAGKTSASLYRRLKMEKVEVGDEGKKLLETVCVE
ncbi:hypothetical protein ACHQM5_008243 [Ranunculus cassubicifolius]